MQRTVKIDGIVKIKNGILHHVNEPRLKFTDVVTIAQVFNLKHEIALYILKEMEREGFLKLIKATPANNYLVKISNNGKALVLTGGYRAPSRGAEFFKEHLVAIIVTVIATLAAAWLLQLFGIG